MNESVQRKRRRNGQREKHRIMVFKLVSLKDLFAAKL